MAAGSSWMNRVARVLSSSLSEINPFRGEEPYIAVDIGSSTIKLLEVQGKAGQLQVRGMVCLPTPGTAVQNYMVVEVDRVASLIREAYEGHSFRAKKAITAVPGAAVIIKRLTLPAQSDKELESTILVEAGNFIPEELENVNLDYQVTDYLDDGQRMDVILVAAKKDIVNSYSDTLQASGLQPIVVDVDFFALENMFELNYQAPPDRAVALVNIGSRFSTINILKNARSTFTGDVPVGGRDITESLMRDLGISFEEAEALKAGQPTNSELADHAAGVLEAAAAAVIDEIHHSLSFFWTAATDETIDHIYLSGGGAQVPGLAAQLAERVGAPVDLANPFTHLSFSEGVDRHAAAQRAVEFAVAVGLATRRPNDK